MFLKANISARRAEASERWSMQIRNELIKNEHAQNSLWYLNSCLWNSVQELHRVMIYIAIAQATVLCNTGRADTRRGTQHQNSVSILPPASTGFYCAFTVPGKQPIWCKQPKYWLSVSYTAGFTRKWKLLQGIMDNSWFGAPHLTPPGRIRFQRRFGPARSGSARRGSLCLMLNQLRAASESDGKRSASTAGTWWARRQLNRQNDNP